MVSDFQTNTIYLSSLLQSDKRYATVCNQIIQALDQIGKAPIFLPNTNDIWARDFMPIQTSDDKFIEYRYDPDYLQGSSDEKDTRELKTYTDIVCSSIGRETIKSEIILDGGNVVKSNNTIILTDKVVWENKRRYSEKQLLKKLHDTFEVEKVVLIPWDEGCEFGHSDGMLRFINTDTVLISGFYEQMDSKFKASLQKQLEQAKLNWEWLRCADKEQEENISYINFLQTKDILLVPSLNRVEDNIAFAELSKFFPEYENEGAIHQIDVREIARYGGALNCISWTILE